MAQGQHGTGQRAAVTETCCGESAGTQPRRAATVPELETLVPGAPALFQTIWGHLSQGLLDGESASVWTEHGDEIASFSGAKAGQECQQPPWNTEGSSAVTQAAVGTASHGCPASLPGDSGEGSHANVAPKLPECHGATTSAWGPESPAFGRPLC